MSADSKNTDLKPATEAHGDMSAAAPATPAAGLKPSPGLFDLAISGGETLTGVDGAPLTPLEDVGTVIAERYVLQAVLGEGGTGLVWRAEQREPVRRVVAVKIIRPGLVTEPVAARFKREHQVLAQLGHPHIAAVFDAGDLPDGRSFFAMELVQGLPITAWCTRQAVPLRLRLEIFLQACQAVQHAHQKGVLHRDLKPSNVMVTEAGGQPQVKVIDFGIAKALSGDLAVGADVTLRGMVLGTPRYMSPEQAGLTGQDVDTRADVYALGVLLYELLTGSTPIEELREKKSTLPELLHQVCQTETELPSKRVTRTPHPAPAQPPAEARALRGELDWIILKALQKDREQRYPTVAALADDIRRHLNGEPVSAGPAGLPYQLRKWLQRHRNQVGNIAAVFASLGVGLAATEWALSKEAQQRREALRHKQAAENEAELARKVSTQLNELLDSARKHAQAGMNTALLRQIADECAGGMTRFSSQPRTAAELAGQLAHLYIALEEPARALPWMRQRWELLRQLHGPSSRQALIALHELGYKSLSYTRPEDAVMLLQEALEGLSQLPVQDDEVRRLVQSAKKDLARALSRNGRHGQAMLLFQEALDGIDQNADPVRLAAWLREQAEVLNSAGKTQQAAAIARRALEVLPQDDAHAGLRAFILSTVAHLEQLQERKDEALAASAERLRLLEKDLGPDHPRLLNALITHAALACTMPGCPGGEEAARRALQIARRTGHESRLADAWTAVAEVLRVTQRFRESEAALRAAITEASATKAEPWRIMEMHRRLGDLLTARNSLPEALAEYETAAAGWFARPAAERPPEKEKLIFGSFIAFWEKAERMQSPTADPGKLAEWRARLAEWEAARP